MKDTKKIKENYSNKLYFPGGSIILKILSNICLVGLFLFIYFFLLKDNDNLFVIIISFIFLIIMLLCMWIDQIYINAKKNIIVIRCHDGKHSFTLDEIDRFEYMFNECIRINLINGEYYEIPGYFTNNKEKFYFGKYIVNKNEQRNLDLVEKANKILIEYKKENGLKI